jgi:hypothetical protein
MRGGGGGHPHVTGRELRDLERGLDLGTLRALASLQQRHARVKCELVQGREPRWT